MALMIFKTVDAQTFQCPPKTTANYRSIIFVGKAGLGGDKQVEVWFEYGTNKDRLNKTRSLVLDKEGIFCLRVFRLKPCTTYYYRAAAKNSAGINYGEIKTIKTLCSSNSFKSNLQKIKEILPNWVVF